MSIHQLRAKVASLRRQLDRAPIPPEDVCAAMRIVLDGRTPPSVPPPPRALAYAEALKDFFDEVDALVVDEDQP
ncbi:MAG: hypothetical protein AAF916_04690 [Planctomycetota bacterium]